MVTLHKFYIRLEIASLYREKRIEIERGRVREREREREREVCTKNT